MDELGILFQRRKLFVLTSYMAAIFTSHISEWYPTGMKPTAAYTINKRSAPFFFSVIRAKQGDEQFDVRKGDISTQRGIPRIKHL